MQTCEHPECSNQVVKLEGFDSRWCAEHEKSIGYDLPVADEPLEIE